MVEFPVSSQKNDKGGKTLTSASDWPKCWIMLYMYFAARSSIALVTIAWGKSFLYAVREIQFPSRTKYDVANRFSHILSTPTLIEYNDTLYLPKLVTNCHG